jgi:hypothetical protein
VGRFDLWACRGQDATPPEPAQRPRGAPSKLHTKFAESLFYLSAEQGSRSAQEANVYCLVGVLGEANFGELQNGEAQHSPIPEATGSPAGSRVPMGIMLLMYTSIGLYIRDAIAQE